MTKKHILIVEDEGITAMDEAHIMRAIAESCVRRWKEGGVSW